MIEKFQHSWQLFKASITVTLRHRKLLLFPALTAVMTAAIGAFFLLGIVSPMILHNTGYHLNQARHWIALRDYYFPNFAQAIVSHGGDSPSNQQLQVAHLSPALPAEMAALYFLSMFLATFFNVAFYSEIISALKGQGVSISRGFAVAQSRWKSVLVWSLLAGLVGWLIHKIQERLPLVGRIVTGLIGMAWSVASVFVIPVIIQEQPMLNPITILKQSAMTLKKAWGEGLIGYMGFSAGNMVLFLLSLVPLLISVALGVVFRNIWIPLAGAGIWLISVLMLAYVSGVASHVYRCALYVYAAEGVVPEFYNQDILDRAWRVKKS